MLKLYFTMPNESITFNNDGMLFNDFTMIDLLGNKACIVKPIYQNVQRFSSGAPYPTTNPVSTNSNLEDS